MSNISDKPWLVPGHMYQYDIGWLVDKLLSFETELNTAIDLKTIHYADPIQWDITTQYAPNTVVVDPKTGTAYMSKVPVPAGILLTNTDYWVVIFNYQRIYDKIMSGIAFNDKDNLNATKDLTINDLVWYGGDLYRCIRAIPKGTTYIPGTNLTPTTIEECLETYYGNDRVANVLNDTVNVSRNYTLNAGNIAETSANRTVNVSGDYTLNAGDIAETSANRTIKTTADYHIDIDGNLSDRVDGVTTINRGGEVTEVYAGSVNRQIAGNYTENFDSTAMSTFNKRIINARNIDINGEVYVKNKFKYFTPSNGTVPFIGDDGKVYNLLTNDYNFEQLDIFPYFFVGHRDYDAHLIAGFTNDFIDFTNCKVFDIIARDPMCIYINGKFYIVCTWYANDYSYDTVIYTTTDFQAFTRHNIVLGVSAGATWAPELVYKNNKLYIFYAHTDAEVYSNMRLYVSECTDLDNLTFANGIQISGINAHAIDPSYFIGTHNEYLIYKNEEDKNNYAGYYNFDTHAVTNIVKINIPAHAEAVSAYQIYNNIMLIADRYLNPGETKYGTQYIMSSLLTSIDDNRNIVKSGFFNPNKDKVSGIRHVSCLAINKDMFNVLVTAIGTTNINSSMRYNPYPEHVNIEDFGTLNNTTVTINDLVVYPNTVYAIFNNPTGVTTHTTEVNINSINNIFNLFDIYIYIGSDISKTIKINTREGVTVINLTASDKDRFIHLRQGIDSKFSVVKGF